MLGGPPNLLLHYLQGGAGGLGLPRSAVWGDRLGRFWSHEFAERIVPSPDEGHVWLITRWGSFREFESPDGSGAYTIRRPASEYRTLRWLGSGVGWVLTQLDGTKTYFRADGLWERTEDRVGKVIQSHYDVGSNRLTSVDLPDGTSIEFLYAATGMLQILRQKGVGGTPTRDWTYTWSTGAGHDLLRIDRPDGSSWRFTYDHAFPARMTRAKLVGTGGSPTRVEAAWEYDVSGRLVQAWRGADTVADGVERLTWEYFSETETRVTDDYGKTTTYTFERESASGKPRVLSIAGECPSCGLDPDSSIAYDNPANPGHPLLPWKITNGAGAITELTYTDFGRIASRTEALASIDERTTLWTYDANFPGFPTSRAAPSVVPSCPTGRETAWVYDPTNGNLLERTESGCQIVGGQLQTFAYTTDFDYSTTTGSQPSEIDPPGFGLTGEDVTSFAYDGDRGDQVLVSRTHPLLGTESYGHDGFNRRITVTDANGVVTTTQYDALDRVTAVTREGATDPADEKTAYFYTALGDLFCVKYPEGNGMLLEYDSAGRLERLTRGTAIAGTPTPPSTCLVDAQPRERTVRTFESYGRVATEQTERCSGTDCSWIVDSTAEHTYESRCQTQKITRAPGTADESVTEYGYDCNARLTSVWDANHPKPDPPSTYSHYDNLDRLTATVQGWEPSGAACVVDAASPDPDCLVTEYAYDAQDHLTHVVDGEGNETTYTYSDRDLLTSQVSNVSGTTSYEYNEHGELLETLDARSIASVREVDGADRVLSETFGSDPALTTTYDYGGTPAQFDVGRLVGITRNGETVTYAYDRFGRRTTDGDLGFTYDKNGRRTTLTYPGGLTATYTFDFADREVSLSTDLGDGPLTLVSGAKYSAQGPLRELTFGTSPARLEQRTFDLGLRPKTIAVDGGQLTWAYTLDGVGNVTAISQTVPGSVSRAYGYQDFQYYLTSAQGPWPGPLAWTYDRVGNRLTETRGAQTDDFTYLPNAATPPGHSALLDEVLLAGGAGGTRAYGFGPAGHLASLDAGANALDFTFDAAGQLAAVDRTAESFVGFFYDGRGYLAQATSTSPAFLGRRGPEAPTTTVFTDDFESGDVCVWDLAVGWGGTECPQPPVERHLGVVYDSAGTVHALLPELAVADGTYVFYLAGRPVALLSGTFDPVWTFVTTDHLGTPILALDATGATTWLGGFEPFGHDWQTGAASAGANGVFLRLPGQWVDSIWEDATLGTEVFYNVHRWYENGTGRYARTDPLVLRPDPQSNVYLYANANPLRFLDPLGLAAQVCCRLLDSFFAGTIARQHHCYLIGNSGTKYGLYPEDRNGQSIGVPRRNDPRDTGGRCESCEPECEDKDSCLSQATDSYPIGGYSLLGPNSNTFAGTLARKCCKNGVPDGLGSAPGVNDDPPASSGGW